MTARTTIAACYGLTGVLNALWGATLPATDARLDLGPGRLGGLLMAMAVGALVAMPVAGRLADRWSGRRLLRLTAPAASLGVAATAAATSAGSLAVCVVVLGVVFGGLNVALSVQAVAVERALDRPVMATMHGTWTLGAVAGGALVTTGLRLGANARLLTAAGAVAAAVALVYLGRSLVASSAPTAGPRGEAGRRFGSVLVLGLIGAAAFLAEGAATDWAGIHATRVLGAGAATGAAIYTVFFAAMTVVRFLGDAVRARLGAATTVRLAATTATAGYGVVLLAAVFPAGARTGSAMAGWALVGAGMALVWPVVVSALGAAGESAGRLSAVTTISYGGGLAGPALIGYVAAAAGLSAALLLPAALALLVAVVAPAALRAIAPKPVPTTVSR